MPALLADSYRVYYKILKILQLNIYLYYSISVGIGIGVGCKLCKYCVYYLPTTNLSILCLCSANALLTQTVFII
jgi:hypothetical protein